MFINKNKWLFSKDFIRYSLGGSRLNKKLNDDKSENVSKEYNLGYN